jgi:hypothetical protein
MRDDDDAISGRGSSAPSLFVERFTDLDAGARKLVEIANTVEPVQDGRIHIERTVKSSGSLIRPAKTRIGESGS